jgi:DNA-binding transcriptional regulator/RsmH inhibitor MraZ
LKEELNKESEVEKLKEEINALNVLRSEESDAFQKQILERDTEVEKVTQDRNNILGMKEDNERMEKELKYCTFV